MSKIERLIEIMKDNWGTREAEQIAALLRAGEELRAAIKHHNDNCHLDDEISGWWMEAWDKALNETKE